LTKPINVPCQACGFNPRKKVSYEYEVAIRFKWKSGNEINPAGHNARWRYRDYRKKFSSAFGGVAHRFSPATGFRRITLVRLYGKGPNGGLCKAFDTDNLAQGAKPIVDVLVKDYNILTDDDPASCERVYKQEPSEDGKHYIRIKVEEFEE